MAEASVLPAPDPPIPIVVEGRSDAALRRVARFGDGWLAAWCTPERFAEAVSFIAAESTARNVAWRHGYQNSVGIGEPGRLAAAMEAFYHRPFDRFERYTPYGTAEDVAGYLRPFADAGCGTFNLTPIGGSQEEHITFVAEVKRQLT